jgi:hypothetical protein
MPPGNRPPETVFAPKLLPTFEERLLARQQQIREEVEGHTSKKTDPWYLLKCWLGLHEWEDPYKRIVADRAAWFQKCHHCAGLRMAPIEAITLAEQNHGQQHT